MRVLGKTALVLGMVAFVAAPALAQRGGFIGSPVMLLRNEGVQKELKLTDDQKDQLKKLAEDFRDKHKDELDKLRDANDKERQETWRKLSAEAMKDVNQVLKPDQAKRLQQLSWQASGAQAFSEPQVQKDLKLTADQKAQIHKVTAKARKDAMEIFKEIQNDREAAMKKLQSLRKDTLTKVSAVLTDDQKKTWHTMTGKPFQFKWEGSRRDQ